MEEIILIDFKYTFDRSGGAVGFNGVFENKDGDFYLDLTSILDSEKFNPKERITSSGIVLKGKSQEFKLEYKLGGINKTKVYIKNGSAEKVSYKLEYDCRETNKRMVNWEVFENGKSIMQSKMPSVVLGLSFGIIKPNGI